MNEEEDNYLNDLSDTLNPYELDNSHRKFCTRCGHQCFPISFHTPDLYKCSECGFSYSLIEKHNLPEMEKVAPVTRNKTFANPFENIAQSFDSYDSMEEEEKKRQFEQRIEGLIGEGISKTVTKKRPLDADDRMLLSQGYKLVDIE